MQKFASYISTIPSTIITLPADCIGRSFAVYGLPDGGLELKLHKGERPLVIPEGCTYYGTYIATKRAADRYTSSILIHDAIEQPDGCYECTLTEGGMILRRV